MCPNSSCLSLAFDSAFSIVNKTPLSDRVWYSLSNHSNNSSSYIFGNWYPLLLTKIAISLIQFCLFFLSDMFSFSCFWWWTLRAFRNSWFIFTCHLLVLFCFVFCSFFLFYKHLFSHFTYSYCLRKKWYIWVDSLPSCTQHHLGGSSPSSPRGYTIALLKEI